jgi:predicted NodU family carbamoyl transferase
VKEAKQISKVDPKPTIQAPGIESSIHQGIVTLDHHKAFALKAIHPSPFDNDWLANPIHD